MAETAGKTAAGVREVAQEAVMVEVDWVVVWVEVREEEVAVAAKAAGEAGVTAVASGATRQQCRR